MHTVHSTSTTKDPNSFDAWPGGRAGMYLEADVKYLLKDDRMIAEHVYSAIHPTSAVPSVTMGLLTATKLQVFGCEILGCRVSRGGAPTLRPEESPYRALYRKMTLEGSKVCSSTLACKLCSTHSMQHPSHRNKALSRHALCRGLNDYQWD